MSASMERSKVARLQKDIADLQGKDAQEAKREADLVSKMARATSAAQSSRSASTITSKITEMTRATSDLASVRKKRADIARSIALRVADLHRAQTSLEKAEDADRKKTAADLKKSDEERARRIKNLDKQLHSQHRAISNAPNVTSFGATDEADGFLPEYDVFISHASEDKDSFVRPFAEKLMRIGITPFYDEMSLSWGDSLRRRIDQGLARSRFGIVVLSKHFFAKEWPQRELDGLFAQEIQGQSRILPIWHEISKDEVARFSPLMADKLALNTSLLTVDEIVAKLLPICSNAPAHPLST